MKQPFQKLEKRKCSTMVPEKKETNKVEIRFPQLTSRKQIPDCRAERRIPNRARPYHWIKGIQSKVWGTEDLARQSARGEEAMERMSFRNLHKCLLESLNKDHPVLQRETLWVWIKKSFQAQKGTRKLQAEWFPELFRQIQKVFDLRYPERRDLVERTGSSIETPQESCCSRGLN